MHHYLLNEFWKLQTVCLKKKKYKQCFNAFLNRTVFEYNHDNLLGEKIGSKRYIYIFRIIETHQQIAFSKDCTNLLSYQKYIDTL